MSSLTMAQRELSKSEKVLLGIVGVMSLVFLCWTFIIEPGLTSIKPLEEEIAVLEQRVMELDSIEQNIADKEQQLNNLKIQYDEAIKIFPKSDRYPELIKGLRESAEKFSLNIINESYGKPEVAQKVNSDGTVQANEINTDSVDIQDQLMNFTVDLEVEGEFNNVLKFIDYIEADKRMVVVNDFSTLDNKTNIGFIYTFSNSNEQEEYDFNSGKYGKDNLFN